MSTDVMKIATLKELRRINGRSIMSEYNQTVDLDKVEEDVRACGYDPDEVQFPSTFSMIHEHKHGLKTEPHMRVKFIGPMSIAKKIKVDFLLDMSTKDYNELETVKSIEPEGEA